MVTYKFVAIDESGDLGNGLKTSKYFILCAFCYSEDNLDRKIRKFITKLNHNKSGKKFSHLHANRDADKIKLKLIKFLDKIAWKAKVLVLKKDFRKVNYIDSLGYLISLFDTYEDAYITLPTNNARFAKQLSSRIKKLTITTPIAQNSLQLADFVSWSVFKNYEHQDSLYFDLIKDMVELVYKKRNPYATNGLPSGSPA